MNNIQKKTLVILTSGGDAPGMNPALRAAVRIWLAKDDIETDKNEYIVQASTKGYNGLVYNELKVLTHKDVAGLLPRGGTVIGAGRCKGLEVEGSLERKRVKGTLKQKVKGLVGVIVIGGDGSFQGMKSVIEDECQVQAIGIPATIDNDIGDTTYSLGVDTALNTVVEIIDKIRDTAAAFRRAFVVEIMGRDCGYLALATAIATESEVVFLPEDEPDLGGLGGIKKKLNDIYDHNALDSVIIAAEGSKLKLSTIRNILETYTKWEVRSVVPGYAQRGGSPSAFDRILGSRFAWRAVEELKNQNGTTAAKIVTLKGANVKLSDKKVDDIIEQSGKNARKDDNKFKELINLHRSISTYIPSPERYDEVGNSFLVIHGPDAPGINAAIRAYTRAAMNSPEQIKSRFRTIAVRRGFEGLARSKFDMDDFIELDWQKTLGFTFSGGVPANLAQREIIPPIHTSPKNWLKGKSISKSVVENIEKNIEKYISENFHGKSIKNNLVVIGGKDAIKCIEDIKKVGFKMPIIYIPASIDNDVTLTDFSIGFDTALNNAVKAIDKIKETALAEGRVFLIETMGGLSGFLPLSIGLATGAEHIFIPELFVNPPTKDDIKNVVNTIGNRFSKKYSPRKTHAILIFHECIINQLKGIDTVAKFFAQKGKKSKPPFEVRKTILGHAQRGGTPSAFDRILATCLGAKAAFGLSDFIGNGKEGFAVVMKEGGIERIEINEFLEKSKTEVKDKEERIKELAKIHCMMASDDWMKEWLDNIRVFSDEKYERNKPFLDLWKKFWKC